MTVVLFQLVVAVGGYACLADKGTTSMAEMGMSTPVTQDAPDQPGHRDAPCQFPWAPGGCATMAPCAPAALMVASAPDVRIERIHPAVQTLVLLAPASVSLAPELPPPRA